MDLTEQIGAFGDVPLDVEVELDRRQLTIREVLALETDSVLEVEPLRRRKPRCPVGRRADRIRRDRYSGNDG